jgi:hydrogenase-4 membrane subunit HyfE
VTKIGVAAALAAIIAAIALSIGISSSDDPFAGIAVGVVALVCLGVLVGIYVLDAILRAGKAARDITKDDRQL